MKKTINLTILFFLIFNYSWSCPCNKNLKFDIRSYLEYTTIIKGEIISVELYPDTFFVNDILLQDGGYQFIKLKVEETFKGNTPKYITLKSRLRSIGGHECKQKYEVGEKWYVFTGLIDSNYYHINGCYWSQKVEENPQLMRKTINYIKSLSSIENGTITKKYCDRDSQKKRNATGKIINGQAQGVWNFLDKKGTPVITGHYLNGEPNGLWIEYFISEKNIALDKIFSKSYHTALGSISVSYNNKGEINYGYRYKNIKIPEEYFTPEEIKYLKSKQIIDYEY